MEKMVSILFLSLIVKNVYKIIFFLQNDLFCQPLKKFDDNVY